MEIEYDEGADAVYIRLKKGSFASNKKHDEFTIFDLDGEGNLLGVELLNVKSRFSIDDLRLQVKNIVVE